MKPEGLQLASKPQHLAAHRRAEQRSLALCAAEAIAGRYQSWLAVLTPAERILQVNENAQHHYWRFSAPMEYSPRLQIQVAFASGTLPVDQPISRATTVLRHLFERLDRFESVAIERRIDSTSPVLLRPPGTVPAKPIERVVASSATAKEGLSKPSTADRSAAAQALPPSAWPAARKEVSLPEPEVARVAEHVLRSIERRAIAQRERQGRR
jgi:hypothetical protein